MFNLATNSHIDSSLCHVSISVSSVSEQYLRLTLGQFKGAITIAFEICQIVRKITCSIEVLNVKSLYELTLNILDKIVTLSLAYVL